MFVACCACVHTWRRACPHHPLCATHRSLLQLRIAERERALAAKAAEATARAASVCGELPVIQSRSLSGREWTRVSSLTPALLASAAAGAPPPQLLVRARLASVRDTSRFLFATLRQGMSTVQAVVTKAAAPELAKWLAGVPKESVLDVTGAATAASPRVLSVTQGDVELQLETAWLVSKALPLLPFSLEDAGRSDATVAARLEEIKAAEAAGTPPPPPFPLVNPVRASWRVVAARLYSHCCLCR